MNSDAITYFNICRSTPALGSVQRFAGTIERGAAATSRASDCRGGPNLRSAHCKGNYTPYTLYTLFDSFEKHFQRHCCHRTRQSYIWIVVMLHINFKLTFYTRRTMIDKPIRGMTIARTKRAIPWQKTLIFLYNQYLF